MLKRNKRKKSKEKKLEILPETASEKAGEITPVKSLAEQIKEASRGLNYISESDAEIQLFVGRQVEAAGKTTVLEQAGFAVDTPVEEKTCEEFFARLIEIQDWFGEEETATAKKFAELKELLEKNLRELKVFKFGKIQLSIYVVGLDKDSILTGIKTEAVET